MAKNDNMLFTCPILCNFNDDYTDTTFIAGSTGKITRTNKKSTIETYVEINDKKINYLLNNNLLKIIIKVFALVQNIEKYLILKVDWIKLN